jgi:hypothetical protein
VALRPRLATGVPLSWSGSAAPVHGKRCTRPAVPWVGRRSGAALQIDLPPLVTRPHTPLHPRPGRHPMDREPDVCAGVRQPTYRGARGHGPVRRARYDLAGGARLDVAARARMTGRRSLSGSGSAAAGLASPHGAEGRWLSCVATVMRRGVRRHSRRGAWMEARTDGHDREQEVATLIGASPGEARRARRLEAVGGVTARPHVAARDDRSMLVDRTGELAAHQSAPRRPGRMWRADVTVSTDG